MGKVYDALRRAEEQRGREKPLSAGAPPVVEWTPAAGQRRTTAVPAWKRWFAFLARHPRPDDLHAGNKRRIAMLMPDSFVAEQFRHLRARLDSIAAQRPLRTLAMTSALPNEGKTTAAINLAVVCEMHLDRRVLLVDCDLRKPKVHRALGIRPEAGLAEVLQGEAPLEKAIVRVEGGAFEGGALEVLAVKAQPANPSELLASVKFKSLIEELTRRYGLVILDTPATLALPDAKTVSELADGLVMVVRADATPQEDVQAALDILDRRRVIGVVLNGAQVDEHYYGY
jgi:capsular exopolysaccharide synthesis family protein